MVGDGPCASALDAVRTRRDLLAELDRLRVSAARGRGKVRLSLRDLAEAAEVPRSSLANYLSGRTLMPADVLHRLVTALGVTGPQVEHWIAAWERVALGVPRPPSPEPMPSDDAPPVQQRTEREGHVRSPVSVGAAGRRPAAAEDLRFAVLGPLQVERDGRPVRLGPRLVELLSLLLLEAGRAVPAARLTELLESSPRSDGSPATLRSHVSHLRRLLAPRQGDGGRHGVLVTVGRGPGIGYRLEIDPQAIDAGRFEQACAEGRRLLDAGDPARAAAVLADGLALWRGPAFADVAERAYALAERARLAMLRRTAWLGLARALSELDRHGEAAARLAAAVATEPYDEGLRTELVLALYAQGRVVEAAEVCREGLSLLGRRGVDSPELRELQRLVLRREIPAGTARAARQAPRPAMPLLPPPVAPHWFVGRAQTLREAVGRLGGPEGVRCELLVVTGLPGVGKTSFALRVAHAAAGRFPDGHLHVDLRGFDPSGAVMTPEEALRTMLEALGVPPEHVPDGLPGRSGLLRDRLAGRRVLVLLDNVRDDEHVRPLLACLAGCGVIVTSRSQLRDLIVTQGAHPLTLDPLPAAEAEELLVRRLGVDRVRAEPEAAAEIIARCGRLPLALSVVAARAAVHPAFALRALAGELRDIEADLGALGTGDGPADVRAVFSWSYRAVSAPAARLFRLLGLHFGADVTAQVAAALAGASLAEVRPLLAELARSHLVSEHGPGRYAQHDLLRSYAGELARTECDERERAAVRRRLADHYLHTAYTAERLLWPHRDPIELGLPTPGITGERLVTERDALDWFTAEQATLLAAVPWAAAGGLLAHAWQLAWTLTTFLSRQGRWRDLMGGQLTAYEAADRLDDPRATAQIARDLAITLTQLGEHDQAYAHLRRALELYTGLRDLVGQAHTLLNLGWVDECLDRHEDALRHDQEALELFRTADHKIGQGRALNAVGWDCIRLGRYRMAIDHCQEALTLAQSLGSGSGEARAWDSLGYAHHHLGDHDQAVDCYRHGLELYRRSGERYDEAETLCRMGDAHQAAGRTGAAAKVWREALAILDDLGHPAADEIRAKLTGPANA
ncbi:tetratricopeptide repeat protein [Sphaerisporangium melleum]|uniref:tetratricopeptide repeat protein n=1 Tax=Sphaerisporangium melleum TaxID=321316 RepID=UPI00166B775F|nr:tetratricopeptide repeat protein [Sphaerisporangium melleum]